ncbi:Smr/MutS family protein [Mongoliitalea daihaiensis]|uniref:Smr/MutS family protein n=1 Tax=Mongoliitalea daihaiensis TaxID=2782006 RepID=UPI001F23BC71|nr:Smr/MutS family protein [Mongoliitalea daihaiensis]UJP65007.1 Smr/MutS family protein [Mongoliitalea daihaiensis]
MNIGDRVRLLHGNEEGVITKISGSKVEIEIEDGFRIPAMKNEVVVVSPSERMIFGEKESEIPVIGSEKQSSISSKDIGVFLSYIPLNDQAHAVYLSNNSSKSYMVIVSEVFGTNSQTIIADSLLPSKSQKISEKNIRDFEEWPHLMIQLVQINKKIDKTEPIVSKTYKFKASAFFKSKGIAPILNKTGYVFNITASAKPLDITALNQELQSIQPKVVPSFPKPPKEVDLHIEKLTKDHSLMSNSEMLKLQMEVFEKNLNYAIAAAMDEISFIHGIGNGILRKEIHRYLSQLPNIKYFKDTQKSPFGFGATLVRIS